MTQRAALAACTAFHLLFCDSPLFGVAVTLRLDRNNDGAGNVDALLVGDGTPGSCTEHAIDKGLSMLNSGSTDQTMTLCCGPAGTEETIALTSTKRISGKGGVRSIIAPCDCARVVLDAQGQVRHFLVRNPRANSLVGFWVDFHIEGLVLRNGRSNNKAQDQTDCEGQPCDSVVNRGADFVGDGGCVLIFKGGRFQAKRTRFENCQALGISYSGNEPGNPARGGAICGYSAEVDAEDAVFQDCRADGPGGAVAIIDIGSNWGAGCRGTFHRSRFLSNRAGVKGLDHGGSGGALRLACVGPGKPEGRGLFSVQDSEFVGNIASGAHANGGAIDVSGKQSRGIHIDRSLFYRNSAPDGGGEHGGTGGGAIRIANCGTPGLVARDTYFIGNWCAGQGGALRNNRGAMDLTDVVFSGNEARTWPGAVGTCDPHCATEQGSPTYVKDCCGWGWSAGGVGAAILWDHSFDFQNNGGPLRLTRVHVERSIVDQNGAITLASLPQRYFTNVSFCENRVSAKSAMCQGSSYVGTNPCVPDQAKKGCRPALWLRVLRPTDLRDRRADIRWRHVGFADQHAGRHLLQEDGVQRHRHQPLQRQPIHLARS